MADLIKIRRGAKGNMPQLNDYELGYCTDEKSLYIGTPQGNVCLCRVDEVINLDALTSKVTKMEQDIADIINRLDEIVPPSE